MDPLYDPIAPTRQGYVTVPLHHWPPASNSSATSDGQSLFFEVFSPPPPRSSSSSSSSSSPRSPSPLLPPLGPGRDPCDKVVLVMGAFCTRRMFEPLAAELARRGYHALAFDHRGVGASGAAAAAPAAAAAGGSLPPPPPPPSTRLLAADALVVADHAFGGGGSSDGPAPKLHVIGASMGGMVACELAVLLARGDCGDGIGGGGAGGRAAAAAPASRLASLTVMVSCRGMQPALWRALGIAPSPGLLEPIVRWLFPLPPPPPTTAPPPPASSSSSSSSSSCPAVARVVERLMRDIVCHRLLNAPYPDQRRAREFVARLKAEEAADGKGGNDAPAVAAAASADDDNPANNDDALPPPRPPPPPLTWRDAYRALWTSRFHELFCLSTPSVGAAHVAVLLGARLGARKAAVLSSCGAPVLSLVAERDSLVAPRAQRELARMLGARVLSVPTGHVGLGPYAGAFYDALHETLRAGRVAMAAATATAAAVAGDNAPRRSSSFCGRGGARVMSQS